MTEVVTPCQHDVVRVLAPALLDRSPDGDPPVGHGDIGVPSRRSRPVDNHAVADDEVMRRHQ